MSSASCPWSGPVGSLLLAGVLLCASCSRSVPAEEPVAEEPDGPPPVHEVEVVAAYPHDSGAFTQGLLYHDGSLYESTGLYGRSSVRRVDLATGRPQQALQLESRYFGEGLALSGRRLVQLTWRAQTGFVYDLETLALVDRFSYAGEGWGLTSDGSRLILSDGSSVLYRLDPESFAETGQLPVRDDTGPVARLNELEFVEGEILANVWLTDRIARISPVTGRVLGWMDLTGLLSDEERRAGADVLNGIAYDPVGKRLFVTGKLWPKLFEIKVIRTE